MPLISSAGKEAFSYNGEVYTVVTTASMLETYYNMDLFEEHGLTVPAMSSAWHSSPNASPSSRISSLSKEQAVAQAAGKHTA